MVCIIHLCLNRSIIPLKLSTAISYKANQYISLLLFMISLPIKNTKAYKPRKTTINFDFSMFCYLILKFDMALT